MFDKITHWKFSLKLRKIQRLLIILQEGNILLWYLACSWTTIGFKGHIIIKEKGFQVKKNYLPKNSKIMTQTLKR